MRALFLLAVLAAAAPSPCRADPAPADQWSARLTKATGKVDVRPAGSQNFEAAQPVRQLAAGDAVRTGKESYAEIAMDGDGVIELQPGTVFVVADLSRGGSKWKLRFGAILSKLRKLAKNEQIQVEAPTSVAAVRGTEFAVEAKGGASRVGVFDEGLLAVADAHGGHEVRLSPNQETSVAKGGAPTAPAALAALAPYRDRMKLIRKRLDDIRAAWRQRNNQQRQELRDKLNRYRRSP